MARPVPVEEIVKGLRKYYPHSYIFRIDNFSLLGKFEVEECESSVFDLCGNNWKLILHPDGDEIGNRNYISLSIEIQDSGSLSLHWEVKIIFQLFVLNQFQPKWKAEYGELEFNERNRRRGYGRFISVDEFRREGYLVNDCALFGVKPYYTQHSSKPGKAESFTLVPNPPNHRATWKMLKFSAFDKFPKYQSHDFVVGNRHWRIEVHPRGFEEGKGNWLSVFLTGEGFVDNSAPKANTYAQYKLRVLDQIHGNHFEQTCSSWFPQEPEGYGLRTFMPLKDLHDPSKGYLVNDTLYVGVEIEAVSVSKYF